MEWLAVAIVVIGWAASHWFTLRSQQIALQKQVRVKLLTRWWTDLESCGFYAPIQQYPEVCRRLERVIAEIQLLGDSEGIAAAQEIIATWTAKKDTPLDRLLRHLREEVRKELKLETLTDESIEYFRMDTPNWNP